LSQIAILSEVARRSPDSNVVSQIAEISRELVDSMGDIVWAINPARDNAGDLAGRMHRFAADLLSARGIELNFRTEYLDRNAGLSSETRRQVHLIFRECINNAARHSRCTRVSVEMKQQGSFLSLSVADNGVGFEEGSAGTGNGLASLRQRAAALGATINWSFESGTTVVLRVPLHKQVATPPGKSG
jgi:signal transduction histidine kinase